MKKRFVRFRKIPALLAALSLSLGLCACQSYPSTDTQGNAWQEDWTILGRVVGVEDPGHGLVPLENPVVLTGSDTYYATWSMGEPEPFTNEEGKETDLYEAQVYMLVYGNDEKKGEDPASTIKDWMDREKESYEILEEREVTVADMTYTVLDYRVLSDSNPYSRGASAFAVFGDYSINVEFSERDLCSEDPDQVLEDFLSACHYNSEIRR